MLKEKYLLHRDKSMQFSGMQFRSRTDGSNYPIAPKSGSGETNLQSVRSQKAAWGRTISRKRIATLKTLENPLLWANFLKKYEKLNPEFDFENEVDRQLEPEEALNQIKKKHPRFDAGESTRDGDFKAEFREDLESRGISNEKVQNLIAKDERPLSEEEIAEVAGALNTRSDHAVTVDRHLKAPITEDVRNWAKHPERYDIKTVDNVDRK
jgi:hypothetical protein